MACRLSAVTAVCLKLACSGNNVRRICGVINRDTSTAAAASRIISRTAAAVRRDGACTGKSTCRQVDGAARTTARTIARCRRRAVRGNRTTHCKRACGAEPYRTTTNSTRKSVPRTSARADVDRVRDRTIGHTASATRTITAITTVTGSAAWANARTNSTQTDSDVISETVRAQGALDVKIIGVQDHLTRGSSQTRRDRDSGIDGESPIKRVGSRIKVTIDGNNDVRSRGSTGGCRRGSSRGRNKAKKDREGNS